MARDLRHVLDAVLDGIVILDARGCVEEINAEACRILESSGETVAGEPVEKLLGAQHSVARLSRQVLASGRPLIEDEATVERRYDEALEVDVAVSPLYEGDDPLDGVVVALRDSTIRNSLRELVTQRDQLASYGHIAAGIAHEVKNPLSGIRGAAELLERGAADEREGRIAKLIVSEVDRITSLVDELMVFAKGEKLQMRAMNIHQVLDAVLQLVLMEPLAAEVCTTRSYDPSIPDVDGDPDRLTQVFLNLGRNALQAMDGQSGNLTVTTRMALRHSLSDAHGHRIPTVEILFEDSGPGIEPDDLKRLATPFFTTKPKGTGLGLAVSRHWVARHGGSMHVSSRLGEGARVRVTLPLHQKDVAPALLGDSEQGDPA